jgi:hypothetical protein
MRHSDISLTMNTYTDERLLNAAGAVELLPELSLASRSNQSLVAPTMGKTCQNLARLADRPKIARKRKTQVSVNRGDTIRTCDLCVPNESNQGSKSHPVTTCDDDREPLHQWLHQLAATEHTEGGLDRLAELLRGHLDDRQRRRLAALLRG